MDMELKQVNIVIRASEHDPGVISPQSLKEILLADEEPTNFVHTPEFFLFESDDYILTVDRERLQISAKNMKKDTMMFLADITAKYVRLLPEIPYQALGINLLWSIRIVREGKPPEISFAINNVDLSEVFRDHEIYSGGIVYARKDPYVLRLVIEPQGPDTFIHNFNYHHELSRASTGDIVRYLENLMELFEHSSQTVKRFYPGQDIKWAIPL